MRRKSPLVRQAGDIDIDKAMTPMIDVVFLLLVFFVWTASFQIIEHVLPSKMSAQLGSDEAVDVEFPPPDDFDEVVIRIGWNGQTPTWQINSQPVDSLANVEQQLKVISSIEVGVPVILHPEPVVPLGHVIEAYDVAKVAGFNQVSFAVNPQGN